METTDINIVLLSCLVFLTNAGVAFYKEQYTYAFLFVGLTVASFIYHSHNTVYTNAFDKLMIVLVVSYGAYLLYTKGTPENQIQQLGVVALFIAVLFLFFYGYCTDNYCFHPEHGNHYHGLLHFLSSLGHHWIIFL